jgi:hypothetical protein
MVSRLTAVEASKPAAVEPSPSKPDPDDYKVAVFEGKQLVAKYERADAEAENVKMLIGERADGVAKRYGENKLGQYAKDIGFVACTLGRCRSVYRAWYGEDAAAYEAQTGKKASPPKSFAVAQELQAHPDRFAIIKDDPDISSRAARRKANQFKKEQNTKPGWLLKNTQRWFAAVIKRAGEDIRDAGVADGRVSPELQEIYRQVVAPSIALLDTLREAGNANLRLADFLEKLVKEAPQPRSDKDEAWEAAAEHKQSRHRARRINGSAANTVATA